MKLTAAILAGLLYPVVLQADEIKIVSPTTAQTYAYSTISWRSLRFDNSRRHLIAAITFSNQQYASKDEPEDEESFEFQFPNVVFDPRTKTFFAKSRYGKRVPVAQIRKELLFETIRPMSGTVVYVFKQSGRVSVMLFATSEQPPHDYSLHWVEQNEGWFLENLVSGVFR